MGSKFSKSKSEDKKKGEKEEKGKKHRKLSITSLLKKKSNALDPSTETSIAKKEDQMDPVAGPSHANSNPNPNLTSSTKEQRDPPKIVAEHVKVHQNPKTETPEPVPVSPVPSIPKKQVAPPLPPKTKSPSPVPQNSLSLEENQQLQPEIELEPKQGGQQVALNEQLDSEPKSDQKSPGLDRSNNMEELSFSSARQYLEESQNGNSSITERLQQASATSVTSTRTSVKTSSSIQEIKSTVLKSSTNGFIEEVNRNGRGNDSDNDKENEKEESLDSLTQLARAKFERQAKFDQVETTSSVTMSKSTFTTTSATQVNVNKSAIQITNKSMSNQPLMIVEEPSGSSTESLDAKLRLEPIKSVIVQELPGVTLSTVTNRTTITEVED